MAITERAKKEEREVLHTQPVRDKKESPTYWNTRILTHSILGKHHRTPQFNMELLIEFLNSKLPLSNQIDKTESKFNARKDQPSLKFITNSGNITFNAHESIDKEQFLRKFGL